MTADNLYDSLRGYLRLTTRVVDRVGQDVNVGERFTIRFTGSNTAYAANLVGRPVIVFDSPRIFVEGTGYARPVSGAGWHNLPDGELFPGEASAVDIEMEAISEIGSWWTDLWNSEEVAKAWITADLDQNRFFQVWNSKTIHQEIEPT